MCISKLVVARLAYGVQQFEEERVPVGVDVGLGVVERHGHVLVYKQVDRLPVGLGQVQVVLLGELQHRPFGELVHAALAHHALLACVYAEEDVEQYAHNRHEEDDQRPCHGLGRLAVVHQHVDDCHGCYYLIDDYTCEVESVHWLYVNSPSGARCGVASVRLLAAGRMALQWRRRCPGTYRSANITKIFDMGKRCGRKVTGMAAKWPPFTVMVSARGP